MLNTQAGYEEGREEERKEERRGGKKRELDKSVFSVFGLAHYFETYPF